MKFELEKIQLDLKVNWKLSRNETLYKENFIFKIVNKNQIYTGEIAPNIRYQETSEKIEQDFINFQKDYEFSEDISSFLYSKCYSHCFQFAVESAFVHLNSALSDCTVCEYLGLEEPGPIYTSYSIPIMEEKKLKAYIQKIERFHFLKIKVNKENAAHFVKTIANLTNMPLRIDGNEAWTDFDSYLKFEEEIQAVNIQFIEQPFAASMVDEYMALKPISHFEIMGDESIEQDVDFELIAKQFHSINVKLMKAGGYTKAIDLLKNAKKYGLKTMLGCMIETSLGISSAIHLSDLADYFDLDGSLLIKEDPFNLITESNGSLRLV